MDIKLVDSHHNYINVYEANLDVKELQDTCIYMNQYINNTFKKLNTHYENSNGVNAPATTSMFNAYNLFLYPRPGLFNLYKTVQTAFRSMVNTEDPYYIQCWLNYFNPNTMLSWHSHWEKDYNAYHGYFCVDANDTITTYMLEGYENEIDVKNKNNYLVIGKSGQDRHKTCLLEDRSRITIAFDIVPQNTLIKVDFSSLGNINHWVPI